MRVVVLYHPKSEHAGAVEDYAKEYKRFKGRELELVSLETRPGAELAKTYDVVRYPAVLAIGNQGELLELWQGQRLPMMQAIDAYFRQ